MTKIKYYLIILQSFYFEILYDMKYVHKEIYVTYANLILYFTCNLKMEIINIISIFHYTNTL